MSDEIRQLEADLCEALGIDRKKILLTRPTVPFDFIAEALGKRHLSWTVYQCGEVWIAWMAEDGLAEPGSAFPILDAVTDSPPGGGGDTWREAVCRAALGYLEAGEAEDCNACEDCHGCPAICACRRDIDRCPNCQQRRKWPTVSWCSECQVNLMLHSHKMDCSKSGRIGPLPAVEIRAPDPESPPDAVDVRHETYAARPAACRPAGNWRGGTFSVGIGAGDKPGPGRAALYRVSGLAQHESQIDALVARLVAWMNDPDREDSCPQEIPFSDDKSARIHLTKAGKAAGFLPAGI